VFEKRATKKKGKGEQEEETRKREGKESKEGRMQARMRGRAQKFFISRTLCEAHVRSGSTVEYAREHIQSSFF